MRRCRDCLLPAAAPGADLDSSGRCAPCRDPSRRARIDEDEARRVAFEADLEEALETCRGVGEYDCLVPFSGGKDSCFLLHRLVHDYKLKVLAFTVDVNLPPLAWDNIRRTRDVLGFDHIAYAPPTEFYHRLFHYLLTHQEPRGAVYTISYVYAPLFEGDALKLAMQKNIPLVLAGYSPGQPEPERMLYEFSRELVTATDWTPPALKSSGVFSEADLARFYNPARLPADTVFPRYLAPFHAWRYSQDEAMAACVEHGLVKNARHASPIFSNYPINWLLMYSDLKNFGYNPYAPEFADLIREGKASRTQWRVLGPVVDAMIRRRVALGRDVSVWLDKLSLTPDELVINQPLGAYDPPLPEASA